LRVSEDLLKKFFTRRVQKSRNYPNVPGFHLLQRRDGRQSSVTVPYIKGGNMKTKLMLGLATMAALALPAMAQDTYCRLDRDGDSRICTTRSYDAYGNVYERRYSTPVNNGYYGNGYYGGGYSGYYNNGWDRHREHEEHERRERIEHERHEWREHHRDRDDR
jgi:hypothetical protein